MFAKPMSLISSVASFAGFDSWDSKRGQWRLILDIGTANTLALLGSQEHIERFLIDPKTSPIKPVIQPSKVAVAGKRILEVGEKAEELYEAEPDHIEVIRPILGGTVANPRYAQHLVLKITCDALGIPYNPEMDLTSFKQKLKKISNLSVLLAIPPKCAVEGDNFAEQAYSIYNSVINNALDLPAKFYTQTRAAAYGIGMSCSHEEGNIIVDSGGGTTDISNISKHGEKKPVSHDMAGDKMNESIRQYVLQKHGVDMKLAVSEQIKITRGCAIWPLPPEFKAPINLSLLEEPETLRKFVSIKGSKTRVARKGAITPTGTEEKELKKVEEFQLSTAEVREALDDCLKQMAANEVEALETLQPKHYMRKGSECYFNLAGGNNLILGIPEYLKSQNKVEHRLGHNPLTAVRDGLARIALNESLSDSAEIRLMQ